MMVIDGIEHISYCRMDANGETFRPLLERLIQTARGVEEKLKNMDPTKTFSNNPLEVLETNMCMTREEKEMCGIYATPRATEKKREANEKSEKLEGKPIADKICARHYTLGDRKQVWKILREKEDKEEPIRGKPRV